MESADIDQCPRFYCDSACQKAHWSQHKVDCKSPFLRDGWRPEWEFRWKTTGQRPAFIEGPRLHTFGKLKYLWGNMPAIDVLNLSDNEGESFEGPINLLFAASGDLRNAVKTLNSLPRGFHAPVHVFINDRDMDVVARNVILLLICLTEEDGERAAECMLHVWYSTLIPQPCVDILQGVYDLVDGVCNKISNKAPETLLGKTWKFGSRAVRVVLTKSQWLVLRATCKIPSDLSAQRASEVRRAIMCAPERIDYRDRCFFVQTPATRLCMYRFRQDGLLLPFGHPRHAFNTPNPTFFRDVENWPMKDSSEPLSSYSLADVLKTSSGPASRDIYGKLYYLLKDSFVSFHRGLMTRDIQFVLYCLDALNLPDHLGTVRFSRIEVSNITDTGYVGTAMVLAILNSLLQAPVENRHATLIALYMNAVEETTCAEEDMDNPLVKRCLEQYMKPYTAPPSSRYDAGALLFQGSRNLVRNRDEIFKRYVIDQRWNELAKLVGAVMKEQNTIVEKWPGALKLRPGQLGAQEEFDMLLRSGCTGSERYVEWQRAQ